MERPDAKLLQYIMRSMTTNDRQLQRDVLAKYVTDDVKFVHILGDVKGKDAYYGVYRAAVTGIDYDLKFIEMVVSDHLVATWVDLNIKLAPLYLRRYHAPTVVLLKLRKCPDGLYRICEQVDHHSVFTFVWALGWPFSTLSDRITRPISGWLLSTSGWTVDTLQDAAAAAWVVGTGLLGRLARSTLPPSVLEAVPGFLAQPLRLTAQTANEQEAESAALQQVLSSINGLLQSAGLGDIKQSIAAVGGDDGMSATAVGTCAPAERKVLETATAAPAAAAAAVANGRDSSSGMAALEPDVHSAVTAATGFSSSAAAEGFDKSTALGGVSGGQAPKV
jgi:hypothetical protein